MQVDESAIVDEVEDRLMRPRSAFSSFDPFSVPANQGMGRMAIVCMSGKLFNENVTQDAIIDRWRAMEATPTEQKGYLKIVARAVFMFALVVQNVL